MIPSDDQIQELWNTYKLPDEKRIHCVSVAKICDFLSDKLAEKGILSNKALLHAAALLHDIDKAVLKRPYERHPDAAVRILKGEGLPDVAALVGTHPLHMILDPKKAPKRIEEKLLFLSDKMAKYNVITVDKRFFLWNQEELPYDQREILKKSYPIVKRLEQEIFSKIGINPLDVSTYIK